MGCKWDAFKCRQAQYRYGNLLQDHNTSIPQLYSWEGCRGSEMLFISRVEVSNNWTGLSPKTKKNWQCDLVDLNSGCVHVIKRPHFLYACVLVSKMEKVNYTTPCMGLSSDSYELANRMMYAKRLGMLIAFDARAYYLKLTFKWGAAMDLTSAYSLGAGRLQLIYKKSSRFEESTDNQRFRNGGYRKVNRTVIGTSQLNKTCRKHPPSTPSTVSGSPSSTRLSSSSPS